MNMFHKYFLSVCALTHFIDSVILKREKCNFNEIQFINFFLLEFVIFLCLQEIFS
jgi:hypothetical protein